MKKLMMLMMMFSVVALAGPDHKNHKKGSWSEDLGLTEAQIEQVKSIKKAKHEKLMAYKEQLATETDDQLAEVLSADQMTQLQAMRDKKDKHSKHRKHKKYKKDKGSGGR